ncbi:MAG: UDP-N-acetylglucosamine 2-epimerase (non-hydrolyzing) [Bacteroidota bacterium]
MIKILTIIGARPQFVKAAALSRAIRKKFSKEIKETLVHTGQHYDDNMSEVFFKEMEIPKPKYNLNIGSDTHGKQTGTMIEKIEEVLTKEKPDCVILYGDTNSTLAGAIASVKIHIPVVHIEAGLRSFNKTMPEEINRIVCDHCSTLLFSPTKTGVRNLIKEGFSENNFPPYHVDNSKIYHCGDVMYDNTLYFSCIAEKKSDIFRKYGLKENEFILATIHRNNNTDNSERLTSIFHSLNKISLEKKINIVLPLHPRTSKAMKKNLSEEVFAAVKNNNMFYLLPPVSFFEMMVLEKNCKMIFTDSGGVQKEAFFFKKPCIILRSETEWIELVECGSAKITDTNEKKIEGAFRYFNNRKKISFPQIFGDGHASEFICKKLVKIFSKS